MQVTVQAGIRLYELIEKLEQYGLSFSDLGSIAEQSIAGAIATGTHGSGIKYGGLANHVIC